MSTSDIAIDAHVKLDGLSWKPIENDLRYQIGQDHELAVALYVEDRPLIDTFVVQAPILTLTNSAITQCCRLLFLA